MMGYQEFLAPAIESPYIPKNFNGGFDLPMTFPSAVVDK
jgi:hypothetical protein